jgi:hypothetical protein
MKALEIIQGLNEQRKNNISKAFDQSVPNKYFEKLDENMSKSEAFEIIQKVFEDGKISEDEFQKAVKVNHKYLRKEGNKYIYNESSLKEKKNDKKQSMFDIAEKVYNEVDYKDLGNKKKIASALKKLGYANNALMVNAVQRKIKEVINE